MHGNGIPLAPPGTADSHEFLRGGGEMGKLIRSMDWSRTPLGAIDGWPQSLRTAVSLCISSNFPFSMAWGPEHIQIYNDGYWPICGGKHPQSMGQNFTECWASAWPVIGDVFDRALAGESAFIENQRMFLDRNGYLEETFFTFSFSPIRDESGGVGGLFHPVTETTAKMLSERRTRALRDIADRTGQARTTEEAFALATEILAEYELDLPFALLYRVDAGEARLVGHAGLLAETAASPASFDLASDAVWPIAEVAATGRSAEVDDLEKRFGDVPCGPYPESPKRALALPIAPPGAERALAVLVAGVSPRLPLDETYRNFFELLAAALTAAIAKARAYEEERRRAEALAEIDRAKTLFFSNVSHEFRTPLTLMLGPLEEVLHRGSVEGREREELDLAHRNGLRLLKLVNSLLDFSRVEAGRARAVYQATDLAAYTADLVSSFRSACERAGLALIIECEPLPEPVYVDREMWEKIVLNLVSNAFKFTFEGEIRVAIGVRNRKAVLEVSDTGTGIPESELPRIFDRFHRIEGAEGRTHEGTGIGLALVQELVKLHGGSVDVWSVEGQGTTFAVRIPLGTAHLPAERIEASRDQISTATRAEAFVEEAMRWLPREKEGAAAASPVETPAAETEDGDRPYVLLADDNADMRDYIRQLLAPRYEVEAVGDGQAALDAAKSRAPDLILTDVMMPRLDGFGLLKAVRHDPRLRETPVVLLSARAGEEAQVEGLEAGADDYLIKPFSARELVARIDTNLNLAQIRREAAETLAESEARFRNMADHAPVMIWTSDPTGGCTYLSQSWCDFTGRPAEQGLEAGRFVTIHPRDREAARETFDRAHAEQKGFEIDYQLLRKDGAYRWVIETARPRFGHDGQFLGFIGSVIDVHERRQMEEHRKLLINELNHRVKNTLAIVQALAQQSFSDDAAPRAARTAFEGRLAALAAAHDLLTRESWSKADLQELAQDTLRSCGADPESLSLEGPGVSLQPKQAVSVAMALHELCTNAMKYGALSCPSGRLSVRWCLDPKRGGRLKLTWQEAGGPPVQVPRRRGFGTRMIEKILAAELRGKVSLDFAPAGLVCTIDAPSPERARASE